MSYRPKDPFVTPALLLNPTYETVKGVAKKTYHEVGMINCSFKTYGGTETVINDRLAVEDTAGVETWYRPDIKSDSLIRVNGRDYEVMGEPENIDMRNQFMKFKVRGIKGGT